MSFLLATTLTAFRVLAHNRLRAGLTMLGIGIGVAAVIAIASIGEGAKAAVQAQIASLGTNLIVILPGAHMAGGVRSAQGSAVTLTVADALALKKIGWLREVAWTKWGGAQIIFGSRNWNGPVAGISPEFLAVRDWPLVSGAFFTQANMESGAAVALLGLTVVEKLFEPGEEPVGVTIRIGHVPVKVIGVLAPKGQSTHGTDQDDIVLLPFTTAERKVFGTQFQHPVSALLASTNRSEDLPEAVEAVRAALRARHRLQPDRADDFLVRTQAELGRMQEGTGQALDWMLFAVASISLLVGGVGIMNILLVSVTERTREIGLRMAVGAKRRHILLQFLIEAVTMGFVGGWAGTALGIAGARATTALTGWPTVLSVQSIGVGLLCSLGIGLLFGLYPANQAARLSPIEALRYE